MKIEKRRWNKGKMRNGFITIFLCCSVILCNILMPLLAYADEVSDETITTEENGISKSLLMNSLQKIKLW